jgi:ribosomal protein S18 acetylase RimI-like enzyme
MFSKRIVVDGGFIEYRISAKGSIELYDFQVEPDKQRQGIGTFLIKKLEEECIGKTIYLFTRKENTKAHAFYKKNGYSSVSMIRGFYTDNDSPVWGMRSGDALLFIKHL